MGKHKYDIFISFQQSLYQEVNTKDNLGATAARALYKELERTGYKIYLSLEEKEKWHEAVGKSRMALVLLADQFEKGTVSQAFAEELGTILRNYKEHNTPTLIINLNKLYDRENIKTGSSNYQNPEIADIASELKDATNPKKKYYLKYAKLRFDNDYANDLKKIKETINKSVGFCWHRFGHLMKKALLGLFVSFLVFLALWPVLRKEDKPLVFAGGATVVNHLKGTYNIDVKNYDSKSLYIHLPSGETQTFLFEDACVDVENSNYYYPVVVSSECFTDSPDSSFFKKAENMRSKAAIIEYELGVAKLVVYTNDTNLKKDSSISVSDLKTRIDKKEDSLFFTSEGSGTSLAYKKNGIVAGSGRGSNIIYEKLNGRGNTILVLGNQYYPTADEGLDPSFHKLYVVDSNGADTVAMKLYVYAVAHIDKNGQAVLGKPVRNFFRKIKSGIQDKVWSMSKDQQAVKHEKKQ